MAALETRVIKLEEQVNIKAQSGIEPMLNALRKIGFDAVCTLIAEHAASKGLASEPFWELMNLMGGSNDRFEFERYRGLVPDEVIRRAYNHRRNWAYGDETIVTRVRQLAGVIDADGNVMPGYVLNKNGCINDINDAPQGSSTV